MPLSCKSLRSFAATVLGFPSSATKASAESFDHFRPRRLLPSKTVQPWRFPSLQPPHSYYIITKKLAVSHDTPVFVNGLQTAN